MAYLNFTNSKLSHTFARMIKTRNIQKSYGDLQVLQGIDLDIKKGEIVSIVGESGAGKSTLLHIIGTLDRPSNPESSELKIEDEEITKLKDKELSRFRNRNIGFIFQFHQLLPEFTALENVMMPGMIAGRPQKELNQEAEKLLNFLNLSQRTQHKPSELSGGEQQRVAIARALINDPKIILADEPSGNLDSKNAEELHQLFFELRKAFQKTFVIVTHNRELAQMSDRTLVMVDGKINA